ncbi:MAG: SDR family oxidoreductase [Nevskiales bacterium]
MSTIVLITGCSTGIGRALALEFNARGHIVYASARRPEALSDLSQRGIKALALDVDDAASIARTVQAIRSEQGRLDVLVNNAGFAAMGPLVELPLAQLRKQYETNVFAPIALVQAALPLLQRGARVVNIGSVSGILTTPFSGAYCSTKAALHSLSDALRLELAPFGIHVITVQPGGIASDFGKTAGQGLDWLTPASRYAPIRAAIEARAHASQDDPTPVGEFAQAMVRAVLAERPAAVLRYGHGSRLMPFLKRWLPTSTLDRVLSRRFKLTELQ